jgi:PAS domain S-box-containing protein
MDDRVDATFETYYPPLGEWFEAHAYPAPDGIAVYFRSITDRVLRESARHESEERFRLLASATTDTIWDWDIKTDALWLNDGFEAMFGYPREDVESTAVAWTSRIHRDDLPAVQTGLDALLQGEGSDWTAEYRFRRRDGGYAFVVDRGHVIRDGAGNAVRMIGGMTDITAQRGLEHQLRQAQRLEAIGQLTGGIAHDFNNLLTVIVGNTELLAADLAGDPDRGELATSALGAARRGAELTQRLLAVSRQQALDPRPVDVDALVRGMEGLLRRTIGEQIAIEVKSHADTWSALVDPAQLEAAILNLVINARDAMEDGGRLTIETSNVELDPEYAEQYPDVQPGAYVLVSVWDTGTGISTEHLERVFDPFFTTKDVGQGTGLGLSMVYGFVKQSGGHARIYSEVGLGTTVRLYLPRAAGTPEPEEGRKRVEPIGGPERILVVEDDEFVRTLVTRSLARLGYDVLVANDGPSALAMVEERDDIKLLFTDVILPGGMNGREVADAALRVRPNLCVLYTSGYTADALIHQGRLDPGVNLLSKPYRGEDLAAAIRRALDT